MSLCSVVLDTDDTNNIIGTEPDIALFPLDMADLAITDQLCALLSGTGTGSFSQCRLSALLNTVHLSTFPLK